AATHAQFAPPAIEPADRITPSSQTSEITECRPTPRVDPRSALVPGGAIRVNDPLYVRREIDDQALQLGPRLGETLVIKGPRQSGKSSLLLRYLAACQASGKKVALIDLSLFSSDDLSDYPSFLTYFARFLLRSLQISSAPQAHIDSQTDLITFVEDRVFS